MEDTELPPRTGAPKAPPPVSTNFDVEQKNISSLIIVWAFVADFGKAIRLSPFSFEDLAAALESDESSILLEELHITLMRVILHERRYSKLKKTALNRNNWRHFLCKFIRVRTVALFYCALLFLIAC